MGKYKQWLHHQEVGRRLREQIATYEQERERVQRMAPSHPTTLPDTSNPVIRALLDFTGRGGTLGRPATGRVTATAASASQDAADPHQRQPAGLTAPASPLAASPACVSAPAPAFAMPAAPAGTDPLVTQLTAQAAQTPADPLEAMRSLAAAQQTETQPLSAIRPAASPAPEPPPAEGATASEWWQRFRSQ